MKTRVNRYAGGQAANTVSVGGVYPYGYDRSSTRVEVTCTTGPLLTRGLASDSDRISTTFIRRNHMN